MDRVVLLSLAEAGGCASPRTPVLACRDALREAGVPSEPVTAASDAEIDAALDVLPSAGLIVATAVDSQLRAVLRRLVRRYAPAPSKRPADLPADRTVPDLPPIGVLPMAPGPDLVSRLGLPRDPSAVAKALLAGRTRAVDLLRTDVGAVTLDGALIGGSDAEGRAVPFRARVEVDDAVLTDGDQPVLAVAVLNADGYAVLDGLPLVTSADPADGVIEVAVAIPVRRGWLGRRVEVEVRRARGRATAIAPAAEVALLDDGVAGTLSRKRTWWMERGAWSVYTG